MENIEEKVVTKAAPKRVWQAWSDMYHWKQAKGTKGYMSGYAGKKVAFKIINVKKNEEFTTEWKSFLVKMKFIYQVKPINNKGSTISCRVRFGGMFGWLTRLFLKKKIKNNLSKSLNQFAEQLNAFQKHKRMKMF
ncbi:MAG: hypothetical protein AMS24_02665 [Chlamydiae bacterium SM23_39]|nr:MAG: hypothetical protein AMS24_02665 [Chlamydiae bacterium SM23_39]